MAVGVIFDVDGVLVDSYDAHLKSWVAMAREHGLTITEAQFAETFGQTSREVIARFWGDRVDDAQRRALDARKEAIYRDLIRERFPAMDGARELIDACEAAHMPLAVGSSAPRENVDLSLELLGRREAFVAVVSGDDVTRGKPDPQVYVLAAERLGLPAGRCVVVEDAPVGVRAGRAAGAAVAALIGTAPPARYADADLTVTSLRDLSPARLAALVGG
jgi:HAD superfamily hydrolase (TIGR01509 family)